MARYTSAYSSVLVRFEEVRLLAVMASREESSDPIRRADHVNALCRGAIVLLSSHLEAFIKELGGLALDSLNDNDESVDLCPSFSYFASKDLIDRFNDSKVPEKSVQKLTALIERDGYYWFKGKFSKNLIEHERFNRGFANPNFKKICSYFNRFGYANYKVELEIHLSREYQPIVNMINHIVDLRNNIAHGDYTTSKTPRDMLTAIEDYKTFCRCTDTLFASWWRTQGGRTVR